MSEQRWPEEEPTSQSAPPEQGEEIEGEDKTAGGPDPKTGEPGEPQSQNADIPAA